MVKISVPFLELSLINAYKCNYLEFVSIVTNRSLTGEEEEGHPGWK